MSIHKIAAKLTVMCALLEEHETADADLPNGRIPTALRLAREASEIAAAEQARLETPTAPLRPAEEIAREMVVSAMQNRITGKAVVALLCGGSRVYVEVDSDGEADDMRRLIARLIEQRDAEHVAERGRIHAGGVVEGLRKARSIVFATVSGEIEDELNRGIDEAIDEAIVRIPAAAQPGDLAGRIRALVQEYAGRWADAESALDARAIFAAMKSLWRALRDLSDSGKAWPAGEIAPWRLDRMREESDDGGACLDARRRAADELEAIVREVKP